MTTAAQRWRDQLLAWAIPDEYLAAVRESPWQFPVATMARRTEVQLANPTGESYARALDALAEPGTVLDVGAAAGAASLPLAGRITELTAVDEQPSRLRRRSVHSGRRRVQPGGLQRAGPGGLRTGA